MNVGASVSSEKQKRSTSQLARDATNLLRQRVEVTQKLKNAVDEQHAKTLSYMKVLQRDIEDKDLAIKGLEIKLREVGQEKETLRSQLSTEIGKSEEL